MDSLGLKTDRNSGMICQLVCTYAEEVDCQADED